MKNVFVSSTFKDFQAERDLLRNYVLPRLNGEAAKYGECVNFCDLRWGVDTSGMSEEESANQVLSICLNEIDRSHPYMIVLLGERYGFMPGKVSIKKETERRMLELDELEISVTQLEIEYGALKNPEALKHTFFFFRTIRTEEIPEDFRAESKEHARRLEELKKRILQIAGDRVFFYEAVYDGETLTNLEYFAETVFKSLFQEFSMVWEEYAKLSYYEKDSYIQWSYLQEKASSFGAFEEEKNKLIQILEDSKENIAALTGAAGTGKSTMFSKICLDMRNRGWTVLPFLCGATSVSTNSVSILRSLIWQLKNILLEENRMEESELEQLNDQEALEFLEQLSERYVQQGKKLFIAVDAVDQMDCIRGKEDDISTELQFVPRILSENMKVFFTYLDDYQCSRKMNIFHMPQMTVEHQRLAVEKILSEQGKRLSAGLIDKIIEKNVDKTPMFLYMGIIALTLMDADNFADIQKKGADMEAIYEEQSKIVDDLPNDIEKMSVTLLHMIVKRLGENNLYHMAQLLALSRHGLREIDIQVLVSSVGGTFRPLQFYNWINFMNELFMLRNDGRFDFLHKCMRKGILDLSAKADLEVKRQNMLTYLKVLPGNDPFREQEIIYHMIIADDQDGYLEYIDYLMRKEDEQQLFYAAGQTYQMILEDGGEWLAQLVRKKADILLLNFINWYLEKMIGISDKEQEIYERIQLEAENRLEDLFADKSNLYVKKKHTSCYSEVYEQLGKIYERKNTEESLDEATEYFYQSKALTEGIEKFLKGDMPENIWRLKYRCADNLGRIYEKKGFNGELRIGGKVSFAGHDKNLQTSLQYYLDANKVAKEIEQKFENRESARMLAESCKNIARLYAKNQGYFENLRWYRNMKKLQSSLPKEVFHYYEQAKKHFEDALTRDVSADGADSKIVEAEFHVNYARLYMMLEGDENLSQGATHFREALKLYESVVKEKHTLGNRVLLADIYGEYAGYLDYRNEESYSLECIKMYEKAAEAYEQLVKIVYSEQLIDHYEECSDVLINRLANGSTELKIKAMKICQAKSVLYEKLYRREAKDKLRDLLLKVNENYAGMIGKVYGLKVPADWSYPEVTDGKVSEDVFERIAELYQNNIILSKESFVNLLSELKIIRRCADFYCSLGKKHIEETLKYYQDCFDICTRMIEEKKEFSTYFKRVLIGFRMGSACYMTKNQRWYSKAQNYFEKSFDDFRESIKYLKGQEWSVLFEFQRVAEHLVWLNHIDSLKMALCCQEMQCEFLPQVPVRTAGDKKMICGHCRNMLNVYQRILNDSQGIFSAEELEHCRKRVKEIDILYIEKNREDKKQNAPTSLEEDEIVLQCYFQNPSTSLLHDVRMLGKKIARAYQMTGEQEMIIKAKDLLLDVRKFCQKYSAKEKISKRGFFIEEAWCYEADAWLKIGGDHPSFEILQEALAAYSEALVAFEESQKYDQDYSEGGRGIDLKHSAALHMVIADILTRLNTYQDNSKRREKIRMHYECALSDSEDILRIRTNKQHFYNVMFCLEKLALFYEKEKAIECCERICNIAMMMLEKYTDVLCADSIEMLIGYGERALINQKTLHKKMGMIWQMKNKRVMAEKQERFETACKAVGKAQSVGKGTYRLGVYSAFDRTFPAPE